MVRDVIDGINADPAGRAWQSLADVLPLLAEASPQSFLRAVEGGLAGDDPAVATLFMDGETASLPGVTSPRIHLLWALMVLCWSENDVSRAAMVLARLATIDPEPDARNRPRPAGCLADVFSLWSPHTSATWALRLAIVDRLRSRWPGVAWPLLLAMIPVRFALSPPPRRPRWRDWPQHPPEEITRDHLIARPGPGPGRSRRPRPGRSRRARADRTLACAYRPRTGPPAAPGRHAERPRRAYGDHRRTLGPQLTHRSPR